MASHMPIWASESSRNFSPIFYGADASSWATVQKQFTVPLEAGGVKPEIWARESKSRVQDDPQSLGYILSCKLGECQSQVLGRLMVEER